MKKIFKISAILMVLPLVATSCFKLEEEDLFDKTASERLDESAADYAQLLTDKGGKWKMEYFATDEMEGYVYIMDFKANGLVQISGMNSYIRSMKGITGSQPNQKDEDKAKEQWGSAQSLWEIITDNGPVLSFNSYNPYFHLFSTPEDFSATSTQGSTIAGRGYEGDYEFTLLRKSVNGDSLFLSGKKREINIIMTRLPDQEDGADEAYNYAYLNQVRKNVDHLFMTTIPRVFVDFGDGDRYVMLNASSLVPTIYDEKVEDALTENFKLNSIVCYDSYAFLKPLEFGTKKVQYFIQQQDGSLLSSDDNKTTISAGDLGRDCFVDTLQTWKVDPNSVKGDIRTALDAFNAKLPSVKDKKGTFKNKVNRIEFSYLRFPVQRLVMRIIIDIKQSTTATLVFFYEPTFPQKHQVQFDYKGYQEDAIINAYWNNYPELQQLVNTIMNVPMSLSAASMLAPTPMTVTAANNADNGFVATASYMP